MTSLQPRKRLSPPVALAAGLLVGASLSWGFSIGLSEPSPRLSAPLLALSDIDGRRYDASELVGKVVVINFWSTWCRPCLHELPAIDRLAKTLGDRGQVLAVAVGDSIEAVRAYRERSGLSIPLIADEDKTLADQWSVIAVPSTFVLDPSGRITLRVVGEYDWRSQTLIERIRRLSAE